MSIAQTIYHPVQPYGHCATIGSHLNGVLIAYYSGPECTDQQAVTVEYWQDDQQLASLRFADKTGNCVLIPYRSDRASIIISLFEDANGKEHACTPVERWRFCTNWQINIKYNSGKLFFTDSTLLRIHPKIGCLVRCNPIKLNDEWLLPIYREHPCYGIILRSKNGWIWTQIGKIGAELLENNGVLIQPTLWYDGTLHALCRNATHIKKAWYAESSDKGKTWSKPIQVEISNDNNSLVVIHDGTASPWMIWNEGLRRSKLILGKWIPHRKSAQAILQLNSGMAASYPNYCFDNQKRLHIVHSERLITKELDYTGPITRHILSSEALQRLEAEFEQNKQCLRIENLTWWDHQTY
jgi:hypothetical protein